MDWTPESQAPEDMTNTNSIRFTRLSLFALAALSNACGGQTLDVGSNKDQAQTKGGSTGGTDETGGRSSLAGSGGSSTQGGDDSGSLASGPSTARCPCSRRPGVGNSFQCAMGTDETNSATIGPEGGLLEIHGQQGESSGASFLLKVPPNALPIEMTVQVTETSVAPPADLIDYSPVYLVEPTDVTAHFPMMLTVPYGNSVSLPSLAIYAADSVEGPFQPLPDSYTNAGFMQGSTMRLGAFVVAAPPNPTQVLCP
jgi:hypothetical protein